ncbi:hypothetical protein ACD661_03580 [Legionella lytica]|uniref:Uncharacterized protein n=1 Tax=Legionella lytica TaxID=96232 RepID=A0ABW8D4K1_9GAMM
MRDRVEVDMDVSRAIVPHDTDKEVFTNGLLDAPLFMQKLIRDIKRCG